MHRVTYLALVLISLPKMQTPKLWLRQTVNDFMWIHILHLLRYHRRVLLLIGIPYPLFSKIIRNFNETVCERSRFTKIWLDLFPSLPVENRAMNNSSPFCHFLCYTTCIYISPWSETQFFEFPLYRPPPRLLRSSSLAFSLRCPSQCCSDMLVLINSKYMPYPSPSSPSDDPPQLFPLLSHFGLCVASRSLRFSSNTFVGRYLASVRRPLSSSMFHSCIVRPRLRWN